MGSAASGSLAPCGGVAAKRLPVFPSPA